MIYLLRLLAILGFNVVYIKGEYLGHPLNVLEISKHKKKPIVSKGYVPSRILGSLYDLHNIRSLTGVVYIQAGDVLVHAKNGKLLAWDVPSSRDVNNVEGAVELFNALKEFSHYDKNAMGFMLELNRVGNDINYRILGIDHTLSKAGDVTTKVTPSMITSLKTLNYSDVYNAATSVLMDKSSKLAYADMLPVSINLFNELKITYTPGTMHVIGYAEEQDGFIKLITSETTSEWVGILKPTSHRLLSALNINDPSVNRVFFVESSDTPISTSMVKSADKTIVYTYRRNQ